MTRRPLLERLALGACRLCLRAHPAATRERYARDMLTDAGDAIRHARIRGGVVRMAQVTAAELLDLLHSGVRDRRGVRVTGSQKSRPSRGGVDVFPTILEWRHAFRRLAAQPGHAAVIVLALALGIGANTVVFSVADAVLFRAPYPNAGRLIELFNQPAGGTTFFPGLTQPAVDEWRRQTGLFERVEGFDFGTFVVTSGAEPEALPGAFVTPGLFPALGVRPALGRLFEAGDDAPGRNRVVLLSDDLWRRHFGADPGVVGREIVTDAGPYTVVGVMPRGFRFPLGPQKLWLPLSGPARATSRLQVVAMLPPGVSTAAAQERADVVATALQKERPMPMGWGVRVMPLRGVMTDITTRQGLRVLLGAVTLVLLIACANVANLFLAQALSRDRELTVRSALGATRWRLVRELLAEGMVLATAGGLAALVIGWWGVEAATALAPDRITRLTASEIRLDGRALLFTLIITLATGVLFAMLPAVRASRSALTPALATRTGTGGRSHTRMRAALVIGEVALSVIVLIGAVLLVRSFAKLQAVEIGYDARNLLQVSVSLPANRYTPSTQQAFFRNLEDSVRSMPGVHAVTAGDGLPAGGSIHFVKLLIEGREPETGTAIVPGSAVAPGYFSALGIRITAGRTFGEDERADAVIISESMAANYWPGGTPIGARIRLRAGDPWKTVVGVASEVHQEHRQKHFSPFEIYTPLWTRAADPLPPSSPATGARLPAMTLFVRAERPMALMPLIKQAVWRMEPGQPVGEGLLTEDMLARAFAEQRFAATLMTLFAGLALALAVAGLYALLSQMVVQRTHEIGVRIALGARTSDVLNLIVLRGMALTVLGICLGTGAAYMLSRYLRSQLYAIAPTDPRSFVAVAMVVTAVALIACWMPARRAVSVDPVDALRTE